MIEYSIFSIFFLKSKIIFLFVNTVYFHNIPFVQIFAFIAENPKTAVQ